MNWDADGQCLAASGMAKEAGSRGGLTASRRCWRTRGTRCSRPPASRTSRAPSGCPPGMTVTVTASPAKGLDATLDLTERLAARGYQVVPHLSARLVRTTRISPTSWPGCGPAGWTTCSCRPVTPTRPRASSTARCPCSPGSPRWAGRSPRVGITGYPESHPKIEDDITIQAMWDKRHHATYIVSNLCFDPAVLRKWIVRIRARGVTLPLYVGLAGPVDRARLLRMAARAGRGRVGPVPDRAHRMVPAPRARPAATARSGCWTAPGRRWPPRSAVAGLHVFTFNQVSRPSSGGAALLHRLAGQRAGGWRCDPARTGAPRPPGRTRPGRGG